MILINCFGTSLDVYFSLESRDSYKYVTEHVTTVNSKVGSSLFLVRESEVILATPVFNGATSG